MADLTVIIPVRNRAGQRLANCLASLRWQTVDAERVDVVISDFGSDAEHAASIDELARQHGIGVVRTDTDEVWNRSRALNLAISGVRTKYTMATDADMVFAPNFLETVFEALEDPAALVVCRCWDLPEGVPDGSVVREDYDELQSRATRRTTGGTGACQATSTAWLQRIGGYDEKFVFWGFEDKDLVSRAQFDGRNLVWIHDRTTMVHQWHPRQGDRRPWRKNINRVRFWLTRFFVHKGPALTSPSRS